MSLPDTTKRASGRPLASLWCRACPLALLAAAGVAAFWLGSQRWPTAGDIVLVAEAKHLDFREVWEDGDFRWRVPVQNLGSTRIDVVGFSTSCSCLNVKPRQFVLAPGESLELEMRLDLTRRSRPVAQSNDFSATFFPQFKDAPAQQAGITVRGKVRTLLKTSPVPLVFGHLVRGQRWSPKMATALSAIPLDELRPEKNVEKGDLVVTPTSSQEFAIRFTPQATLPAGPFRLDLFLFPKANTLLPPQKIVADGFIHEEVEPFPKSIMLGARPIGQIAKEQVSLRSLSGTHFSVDSWEVSDPSLVVVRAFSSPKESSEFLVSQGITGKGEHRNKVTFKVSLPNRTLRVPLEIAYHGLGKQVMQ